MERTASGIAQFGMNWSFCLLICLSGNLPIGCRDHLGADYFRDSTSACTGEV